VRYSVGKATYNYFSIIYFSIMKTLFVLFLSLSIFTFAHAAPDPDRYLLTAATLQKLQTVNTDLEKLNIKDIDDNKEENNGGKSVQEIVKAIDAHPKAKAAIAKQGMTSADYALAMHAIFAEGFYYLMFEPSMDK
jgi:hypothetical protein